MKFLRSTEMGVNKDKNGENILNLEINEVILLRCNIFIDNYESHLRVSITFIPKKSFGNLTKISSHSLRFLATHNIKFTHIKLWFTDQNRKCLVNK